MTANPSPQRSAWFNVSCCHDPTIRVGTADTRVGAEVTVNVGDLLQVQLAQQTAGDLYRALGDVLAGLTGGPGVQTFTPEPEPETSSGVRNLTPEPGAHRYDELAYRATSAPAEKIDRDVAWAYWYDGWQQGLSEGSPSAAVS